jgi:hypothetical protein
MSWWSDKLGTPPPPPQQQQYPQAYAPAQQYAPAPQYPPQQQQPQQPQFVTFAPGMGVQSNGYMVPYDVAIRGNMKDGAAKFEREVCPECGDPRYFTRASRKLSKINLRTGQTCPPAPICEACGYNGMFEQYASKMADVVGDPQPTN